MNGPPVPPSAHSSSHLSNDVRKRHHLDSGHQSLQGNLSKRPRVRDYVGSRGPQRHLMVDLPQRQVSQMPSFFPGMTAGHLLAAQSLAVPLLKTSSDRDIVCDKPSSSKEAFGSSSEDVGAPLDLCMKKPRNEASSSASPSFPSSLQLEDLSRRLSESSDGSANSQLFPKKRGRKPKSLLASSASGNSVPTAPSHVLPSIPVLNDRPRKRGRPPLMSPPPNIDVASVASSSGKFGNNAAADQLALISSQLQANVFAQQQQQLAAAQAAGWPASLLGSLTGSVMPNAIKDLFLHQLSSLQASLPQQQQQQQQSNSSTSRQPHHQMAREGLLMNRASSSSLDTPANDTDSGEEDSIDDFKPGTNEEDIRIPLRYGWRRYTIIKRIGSTGVRGDVLYMSPEGKKLRTLNDIQKYLNKTGVKKLNRDNFSFSCKWFVGEFNEPSEDKMQHRILTESEVINRVEELKRLKRKKLMGKNKRASLPQSSSLPLNSKRGPRNEPEAGPSSSRLQRDSLSEQQRIKEEAIRAQAILQLANFRIDELKMMEMIQAIQKNNQQNLENERRLEEEAKKAQAAAARAREIEMKRQQEEQLQKEQELQRRREQQMLAEIERERRRQHMLLVRNMDFHRKMEERERRKEEIMAEKRLQHEKKMQKKRLEVELVKELKKPVDDMRLKDLKTLPTLNRIPGMKLAAKPFSDLLMVYEFLNNFGETLGFDMENLMSLNTMQLALLNMEEEAGVDLIKILQHLLVCAIEDPGLPVNMTTVMGQKLKDVPINMSNVSEILRLYFLSFVLHRKSAASGREGYIFKSFAGNKHFVSLCPTLKAEILAYLCNELLCNQAIVKQLEDNIETVASLRKDKWTVDCDLRKYKGIKAKREKKAEEEANKEKAREEKEKANNKDKEGDESMTENKDANVTKEGEEDSIVKKIAGEDSDHESGGEDNTLPVINDQDEEPEMTNEEIDKKIDKLSRQCTLVTNKLNKAVNGVRVTSLGQDRYRRRYWTLPAAGGVFVEGMESGEPEEIASNEPDENDESEEVNDEDDSQDMDTTEEIKDSQTEDKKTNGVKDEVNMNGVSHDSSQTSQDKSQDDSQESSIKVEKEESDTVSGQDTADSSLGISPLVATGVFGGKDSTPEKSAPQGLPFPLVNHTPVKNEGKPWFSLLPRVPCSKTILDIPSKEDEPSLAVNGETDSQDSKSLDIRTENGENVSKENPIKTVQDIINHLVAGGCLDLSILTTMEELGEVCPSLQKKLLQQKEEQYEDPKKIPADYQFGWWRMTDMTQIKGLLSLLDERGVRERILLKHIQKYLPYITTKCKSNAAEFDVTELDGRIYEECPFGAPRDSGRYSKKLALEVDKIIVEEIEALEEKIAASSMQVRGWRPSVKIANDSSLSFKRSLAAVEPLLSNGDVEGEEQEEEEEEEEEGFGEDEDEDDEDKTDVLSFAKEKLLATETMIERRYLKPPLGFKSNTIVVSSGTVDDLAENAADGNAPSGLLRWRDAVRECPTTSQLALLVNFLESCIAWDKSIMRASCQFCSSGENEAQLLLCDGCDKGYHMYCFKPKMEEVPDGDWFCFECQNKNTIDKVCIVCGKKGKLLSCDTCPKVFHPNCVDPPVSKPPKGKWSCHVCVQKPRPKKNPPRKMLDKKKTSL